MPKDVPGKHVLRLEPRTGNPNHNVKYFKNKTILTTLLQTVLFSFLSDHLIMFASSQVGYFYKGNRSSFSFYIQFILLFYLVATGWVTCSDEGQHGAEEDTDSLLKARLSGGRIG